MFQIIRDTGADFIGLQCVTSLSRDMLLSIPYIQDNYFCSANSFSKEQGYGMLILTRFHCWFYEKKFTNTQMGRGILFAEVKGHDLTFATTHFESFVDQ